MTVDFEKVFALEDEALKCPYDHFKQSRSEAPVTFGEGLGFWVVSDHENVTAVLKDAVTFSTKMMLGPQVSAEWQAMIDQAAARPEGRERIGPHYGESPRKTLLFADPPEHTVHRKLITSALSPAAIRSWEDRIRETATQFVDELEKQPATEFVESFATPYTMTVITDVLGLSRDLVPQMLEWAAGFNSMVGNPNLTAAETDALVDTRLGFDLFFSDQIAEHRKDPKEDLISRVVEVNESEGTGLSNDELLMVLQLVLVGGSDTSSTALAKMIEYLADHDDQWQKMADDPKNIQPFMEELLRAESPVQGTFRAVTKDVELGGKQLSAGDMVWVSIGSANHDPKIFEDPDEINTARKGTVARYVSFGGGPHTCPGTALTRLELRIVLELLTTRFRGVRLTEESPASKKSFLFFGPEALHVEFKV